MKSKFPITFVTVGLLSLTGAFAQTDDNGAKTNVPGKENSGTLETADSSKTVEKKMPSESGSVSKMDKKFLRDAARGGMAEVELSELAKSNSSTDSVKDFASMMVSDHTAAGNSLKELAKSKNVELPDALDEKHAAKKAELTKMTGTDFDKAYLKSMVMDHEMTVEKFEMAAKDASDPEVKAFATKTLPTLKEHLEKVKMLAKG